jgi:hypothetical protein
MDNAERAVFCMRLIVKRPGHDGVWWGCHPKVGGNPPMDLGS